MVQHTVNPVANAEVFFLRLKVNVGGPVFDIDPRFDVLTAHGDSIIGYDDYNDTLAPQLAASVAAGLALSGPGRL